MEQLRNKWDCCGYGAAELTRVWKSGSTLRIMLRDAAGNRSEAVYRGCIYWRLGPQSVGVRLSSVRRVSARELLQNPRSVTVLALHKSYPNVAQQLHDWENEGYAFYLHRGGAPYLEFLVVCQSLEFHDAP